MADSGGVSEPAAITPATQRAITQICAGIAHDFNNLLAVLRGNLHLLAIDADAADAGEMISGIAAARSAADEAALRVQGLALLARTAPDTAQPLDLNALVRRLADLLGELIGNRIAIRLVLADTLPPVAAVASDIEAAVFALAVNARAAIVDQGELTLTTRLTAGRVCLDVADTGFGMTEEALVAAMQPLATSRSPGHAAGLGLSIVQRAMELAGGEVIARSTQGEGTTVTLAFPPMDVGNPAGSSA